jgi:hypothetical protein
LSLQGAALHDMLHDMLADEKAVMDFDARQVICLPAFEKFLGKMLQYLDEVYYIEKRRAILETGEDIQTMRLMPSEKERLNLKASECAYAYSGVLFKTVWKPNLRWEV